MASPLSQIYARSMQLGMAALVQLDRRFGNLILDDSDSPHPLIEGSASAETSSAAT